MPLSRRYTPEWFPGERANIGMDYSYVIPPGVGIAEGWMLITTNDANPAVVSGDFTSPDTDPDNPDLFLAHVRGRVIYVNLEGGTWGRDYRLQWVAVDTAGNLWPRTALMLCSPTS